MVASLYALSLLGAAVILIFLAAYLWQHPSVPMALPLGTVLFLEALRTISCPGRSVSSPSPDQRFVTRPGF